MKKSIRKCLDSALSLNISYCFFPTWKESKLYLSSVFMPTPNYCSPVPFILKKLNPITVTIVSA